MSGIELREVEDVVDQRHQRFGRLGNRIHIGLLPRIEIGAGQKLRHAQNAIHRCAELMTNGREEVRFGAIGLGGAAQQALQFFLAASQLGDISEQTNRSALFRWFYLKANPALVCDTECHVAGNTIKGVLTQVLQKLHRVRAKIAALCAMGKDIFPAPTHMDHSRGQFEQSLDGTVAHEHITARRQNQEPLRHGHKSLFHQRARFRKLGAGLVDGNVLAAQFGNVVIGEDQTSARNLSSLDQVNFAGCRREFPHGQFAGFQESAPFLLGALKLVRRQVEEPIADAVAHHVEKVVTDQPEQFRALPFA